MKITKFVIHKAVVTDRTAEVKVTFENFGKKVEVAFLLSSKMKPATWRIANIKYEDGSDLLGILKGGN